MPNVGRAEVEIVADLSKFGRNLQRDLQKAVNKTKIDGSGLGDGIGDGVKGGVDRASASLKGLAATGKKALGETEDTARRVGRKIGQEFQDAYKQIRSVFSKLSNVLFTFRSRAILFGAAITLAVAGIVAATDELLGLLLPAPAILAGVGAAAATLNVALLGMSDAFATAFEEAEKFEEAIKFLAPAAQNVAREVRALVPLFQSIRIDVQQAFWEQLETVLTKVASVLAGPLRAGMVQVSQAMGSVVLNFAKFLVQRETVQVMAEVFDRTAASVDNIAAAIIPFLEGMRTLVDIFAPEIERMTANLQEGAESFRDWAEAAQESGEALERFEQAAEFMATLGQIVGGALRLVAAATRASHDAGVDLFRTVADLIDQAADLADTVEAQAGLQQFFQSVDQLIRALLPVLGAAAVQIGRLTTPLADLVTALAPGVKAAFEGIADALIALVESGGETFAEALSDAFIILAPHLAVVGELAGKLLEAVAPLLDPLARLIGFILEFAGGIALLLVPLIEPFTHLLAAVLTPLFESLLQIAEVALPPLADAFERLAEKATPLIEALGGAFLELVMLTLPIQLEILRLIIDGIVWVLGQWEQANDFVVEAMKRVWNWIKENLVPIIRDVLWPAIRDELIPALQDLWAEFSKLWDAIKDLWEEVLELVRVLANEFLPEVDLTDLALAALYAAVFLVRYWVLVLTAAVKALTKILGPHIDALKRAADAVKRFRESIQILRRSGVDLLGTIKSITDRGLRVINTFKSMMKAAQNLASAIYNIPSLPSGLSGGLFNFFADGGIVNRATAAIIGEAGPEVVLPLTQPRRARELAAESGLLDVLMSGSSNITQARSAGRASGGDGAGVGVVVEEGAVVIQFSGGVPDEQQARRVGNAAGEGLLNTLAARNVRLAIRGI